MISNTDKKYMRVAIDIAQKGIELGQTPFGAVIVKDDKVIASGHNRVWRDIDVTAHAEIISIKNACSSLNSIDLSGCTIYSTCEPCPMCFSAIHWGKIEKIVYGATIEDALKAGFNELNIHNNTMKNISKSSIEITPMVLQKECIQLFKSWSQREDKRVY